MGYQTSLVFFVLCGFFWAAIAAPWPSSVPVCAKECPITDRAKFKYQTDKTYVYHYSGISNVELKGVDGAVTTSHWEKTVLLSWLSPCEMAITFKDVKVDGNAPKSDDNTLLTRYPLVVAMTDGKVQRVCSHPSDEPWAINLKKGVATAFQNVLPSLSVLSCPLYHGINFTETDVSGRCTTKYMMEKETDKFIVTKQKDHRQCLDQYVTPAETPLMMLKAPVPIDRSYTTCRQEITNGIYSSIKCKDEAVLKPSFGAYKYIEANQESELKFVSESQEAPESLSTIRGEYDYGSLLFDYRPLHKQSTFTTLLEEKLKELCEKTKDSIEHDSASLISGIIQVMKRVPDRDLTQMLDKIRRGQICPQKERLEHLFLHATAFTYDSGSVKIIVDELLKGTSSVHTALFSSALYNTHHPDTQALREIKRLFDSKKPLQTTLLSAASMINKFCRHHHECKNIREVEDIMNLLNARLQLQCSPHEENDNIAALTTLEAIGNIGVMTPDISKSALKCIETNGVRNNIRIAAVRSFRNSKCQRYVTLNLVKITVDQKMNEELRIASYLAAMRCAEKEDIAELMYKISKEDNTQVRNFVLSHMLNIQQSTKPEKKLQKYLLNDFVIPKNFSQDFRRYSQNIDSTFYAPSLGLGGGIETNIIYGPGNFIPRSLAFNITSMLYGQSFHMGEFGARFEGFEDFLRLIFAPNSLLKEESTDHKLSPEARSLLEHIFGAVHNHRSIDVSSVGKILKKVYEKGFSKDPYVELYANIMGQDLVYKLINGNLKNIDFAKLLEGYTSTFDDIFSKSIDTMQDNSHMSRIGFDYYLPTGHGTPLRMRFTGTAILGMKMACQLNLLSLFKGTGGAESNVELIPGLSVDGNGFIGYENFLSKTGLQMKHSLSLNGGISLSLKKSGDGYETHIDLPENMDLIQAESQAYIMKEVRGSPEQVIIPASMKDDRIKRASCINEWEPMLGFKICYKMDVPDIFHNNGLPLGAKSSVKFHIEKSDPTLNGYKIKTAVHNNAGNKELNMNIETKGLASPRKTEATVSYAKHENAFNFKANVMGPSIQGGFWVISNNEANQRNFEIFGEYNSNARKISQGFKTEFKSMSSSSDSSKKWTVFASQSRSFPPGSEVFSLEMQTRRHDPLRSISIIMQTLNTLTKYIDLKSQADFDLQYHQLPAPLQFKGIRKLDLRLRSAGWEITSNIVRESPASSEATSAFKLLHRDKEIIKYTGKHLSSGSMGRDYSMQNVLEIKLGTSGFKIDQQFLYEINRKALALKIMPLSGSNHHLNVEAKLTHSDREHRIIFLADVPVMSSPLKLTGRLRPNGETDSFDLQVSLLRGESKALEITGPCHIKLQPQDLHIRNNLQIKVLNEEPFKWNMDVQFTHKKLVLSFELANQRESLVLVGWKFETEDLVNNHMEFIINIADFVKHRANIIMKQNQIQINVDNTLVPLHGQRVKADLDVFYVQKKAKFEALWDADKDPNKKVIIESQLTENPSHPRQYSIESTVNHEGRVYKAHLDVNADYLIHPAFGNNGVNFRLTNTEGKSFILEGNFNRERREMDLKVNSNMRCKTWDDTEYKFINLIDRNRSDGKKNLDIRSEIMYKSPHHGDSALKVDLQSSEDSTLKREVTTKVSASVPGKHPVDVGLKFVVGNSMLYAEAASDSTTSRELLSWKTLLHERGQGLKSFEVKTDFTGMAEFLTKVREIVVGHEGSSSIATYTHEGRRSLYQSGYENFADNKHSLWIRTPDRLMHGEGEVSPTSVSLHLFPDKSRSDKKYEIQLLATKVEGMMGSSDRHQWSGHLRHSDFPRDRTITFELSSHGAGLRGKLEIDILPDAADKLTGTITSTPLTEDSTKIEAILSSRILSVSPILTAVIAHSPHTVGFDVSFKKAQSEPESFMIAGKYDRTTYKNNAVSFEIRNNGQHVIQMTAVTEEQMKSQCNGMHIKVSAATSFLGNYHIHADACKPLYVEISANKNGEKKMYITKFGYEKPNRAEISLSTKEEGTLETKKAFLARLMLNSPLIIKLDWDYQSEEIDTLLNYLRNNVNTIKTSVQSWIHLIKETLQEAARAKHIQFPSVELSKEWKIIIHEATVIFHDIRDNKIHAAFRKFKNFVNSPSVSYVKNVYQTMWIKMAQIHKQFIEETAHKILDMISVFREDYSPVIKGLKDLAQMVRTGEVPEFIHKLKHEFEESWLYQTIQEELNNIREKYPTQFESMKEVWSKICKALLGDLERLRVKLLALPTVVDLINWTTIHMSDDYMVKIAAESIVTRLLQEAIYVSVETLPGQVDIEIPLREDIYSLNQLFQIITQSNMIKNIIWRWDTYITLPVQRIIQMTHSPGIMNLRSYLPPFNGTAMLVGNNEILTFDGLRFRIPKTPCEIKLLDSGRTTLSFKHQVSEQYPTMTLIHKRDRVIVRPDFRVSLNGHDVSDHDETPEIAVKNTEHDVRIMSPTLSIHIIKNMRILEVKASGWYFGNMAGILGTFDGERANDWMMPTGHLANNVQQFVSSWHEDQHCQTPAIEPVQVSPSRMVTCHTLLGMRSRCNPLLDPQPFIQMCREAENPCDAAKAYRYLCSQRGILEPYPQSC